MRMLLVMAALLLASCQVQGEPLTDSEYDFIHLGYTEPGKLASKYAWRRDVAVDNELGYYVGPEAGLQLSVYEGSLLTLKAMRTPLNMEERFSDQPFLTTLVSSKGLIDQVRGRFDVDLQIPSARGSRAVITLDSGAVRDPLRIVVLGGYQDASVGKYQVGIGTDLETVSIGLDLSSTVNQFSVVIDDESVVWYFNGEEVHKVATPRTLTDPRHVVVAHSVGGNYSLAVRSEDYPAVVSVSSIRFGQKLVVEEVDPISPEPESPVRKNDETPITWEGVIRIIEHLRDVSRGEGSH